MPCPGLDVVCLSLLTPCLNLFPVDQDNLIPIECTKLAKPYIFSLANLFLFVKIIRWRQNIQNRYFQFGIRVVVIMGFGWGLYKYSVNTTQIAELLHLGPLYQENSLRRIEGVSEPGEHVQRGWTSLRLGEVAQKQWTFALIPYSINTIYFLFGAVLSLVVIYFLFLTWFLSWSYMTFLPKMGFWGFNIYIWSVCV